MTKISKNKRIWIKFLGCWLIAFLLSEPSWAANQGTNSNLKMDLDIVSNGRGFNPWFKNIKHILLLVDYYSATGAEDKRDDTLSEPIRKKNLQKILLSKVQKYSGGGKITVIEDYQELEKNKELRDQDGTVTIVLAVSIVDGIYFKPPLQFSLAGMSVYAFRPENEFHNFRNPKLPMALPLNESEESLEKDIDRYITQWMQIGG